jgi:hypothetical protein
MLRSAVFVLLLYPCGLSGPTDVQMRDRSAQSHAEGGGPRDPRVPDPPPASDPIDSDGDGTPD